MAFVRVWGLIFASVFLGACRSLPAASSGAAFEEGYRQGISRNIGASVEKMTGNDFPYLAGTWAQPLVQKTRIPAHVQGGVFYPEHDELVIITPGEWRRAGGYPLRSSAQKGVLKEESIDLTVLP